MIHNRKWYSLILFSDMGLERMTIILVIECFQVKIRWIWRREGNSWWFRRGKGALSTWRRGDLSLRIWMKSRLSAVIQIGHWLVLLCMFLEVSIILIMFMIIIKLMKCLSTITRLISHNTINAQRIFMIILLLLIVKSN